MSKLVSQVSDPPQLASILILLCFECLFSGLPPHYACLLIAICILSGQLFSETPELPQILPQISQVLFAHLLTN